MANNIQEDHTEGESDLQSQESISTQQTENTNPTQAVKDMEVHHHAHHGGKRNWKSYFWEFIMLFLAVFCGFLAEYQLEHTIEHDREKQYIVSMMADMREDSAKISSSLLYCTKQLSGFDTLIQNIYNRPYNDSTLKVMYSVQLKYTHNRNAVRFTKRTITQLKNSGGLRLIRNEGASDSIILYSEDCEQAEAQAAYFENVRMGKISDYSVKLFDNQFILDSKGRRINDFFNTTSKIALLDNDDKLLREYANAITYARGSLNSYVFMLKAIQKSIQSKLKFLQDKYDL